jgi:membrane-associated phospholipid phosphatase
MRSPKPAWRAVFVSVSLCLGLHAQTAPDPNARDWSNIVPHILQDQKETYIGYPDRLVHGKNWLPTAAIAGTIAVLAVNDQFDAPQFRRSTDYKTFNNAFSGTNTAAAIVIVPIATYLAGIARADDYAKSTAFLTGEALVDTAVLDEVMKVITRRARPHTIAPHGNFADNWFESSTFDGSFPSGHTIAAFSVATIMSRRYGHTHRWVPYLCYGAASAVAFSRVTASDHYISDVAMGAALGYIVSRFVVLKQARE